MDTDDHPVEAAVLTGMQVDPELSPAELADRVARSTEAVERALDEGDVDAPADGDADWSDPDRCPFCGAALPDGGPGFVDHGESAGECAVAFARWREGVAGDVEGEWVA